MEDLARLAAIIMFSIMLLGGISGLLLPLIFPKSNWKIWASLIVCLITTYFFVENGIFVVFFGISFIPTLLLTAWWKRENK